MVTKSASDQITQNCTKSQESIIKADPFIGPLIKLVCYNKFSELKKRFRVYDENCCVLIGAIDPYDCLEEGEVYASFCKHVPLVKSSGDRKIVNVIEGKVLVTRNPCVHPGDVRVLTAVKKDQLKDYINVILFSAKGNRPEQDKMSSGDLDGDIYWINWRKEFIENFKEYPPHQKQSCPVKQYSELPFDPDDAINSDDDFDETISCAETQISTPEKENIIKDKVKRVDCIQNFIRFISNDYLGEVANLHSKVSDSNRSAIKMTDCLKLAEMHSLAVDFQKHGELLDIDQFSILKVRYSFMVDFMCFDRKHFKRKTVIESPGVLGQMHRDLKKEIKQEELLKVEFNCKILRNYSFLETFTAGPEICCHFEFLYLNIVRPYNKDIKTLMIEKNLCTESDIFNKNCTFSNMVSQRDEMYGHQADIEMIMMNIEDKYRFSILKDYKTQLNIKRNSNDISQALKFVSYFDLKHLDDPHIEKFSKEEGFINFVKILQEDESKYKFEQLSFDNFQRIISSNYAEEDEIIEVVEQTKILSAWWFLTR